MPTLTKIKITKFFDSKITQHLAGARDWLDLLKEFQLWCETDIITHETFEEAWDVFLTDLNKEWSD